MGLAAELDRARDAYRRQAWADACTAFAAADAGDPLSVDDLEKLAECAQMLGRGEQTAQVLRRAYQARADAKELGAAVRCAYWLQDAMAMTGDYAQAAAWLTRASKLTENEPGCGERGYLLVP